MTNKKKLDKKWLIGIAVIAVAVIVILSLTLGRRLFPEIFTAGEKDGDAVLYYTLACLPCLNVKDYIEVNGITGIIEKEISENQAAAKELSDKITQCGKDVSQGIAIPVLWAENKCFVGEAEVMEYLKDISPENIRK